MIEELKNTKDNVVGKVKDTAGQLLNNDRLELTGKLQTFKSEVGEKITETKEEAAEKVNEVIEWTKPDRKGNNNTPSV
ncbi:MAG: CsbD-like [Firmicutes bacterium]|nr:CsbD-like [Bacillota bacterium]